MFHATCNLLLAAIVATSFSFIKQPKIVDIMPAFFEVDNRIQPASKRATEFRELIAQYPGIYKNGEATLDDAIVESYLASVARYVEAMRSVDKTLRVRVPRDVAHFKGVFPDFGTDFGVYLVPSLNGFDGTVRDVGDQTGVLLGVDEMAALGKTSALQLDVVVTHEFVHLYQAQRNPVFQGILNAEAPPVYATLWSEGLASYASAVLNPPADIQDALGKQLSGQNGHIAELAACRILAHLDDLSAASSGVYFDGNPHIITNGLPHRSGYLVGFRVVQRMAALNTLDFLLQMHGDALRATIGARVGDLCRSSGARPR